ADRRRRNCVALESVVRIDGESDNFRVGNVQEYVLNYGSEQCFIAEISRSPMAEYTDLFARNRRVHKKRVSLMFTSFSRLTNLSFSPERSFANQTRPSPSTPLAFQAISASRVRHSA